MLALCGGLDILETLRRCSCCLSGSDPVWLDAFLIGENFSGRRIGQSSSVGVPASASTNVRCAFGGLLGSMTCAMGGLGRGLLRLDREVGFLYI
jgi:hypothetical protein